MHIRSKKIIIMNIEILLTIRFVKLIRQVIESGIAVISLS
jgi:hypothetical protein